MEKQKRHIPSLERNLIIGLIISLLVLATLLYFYHNHWNGLFIVNDVPTSIVGVGIIFIISVNLIVTAVLMGVLLFIHFPVNSKTERQTEKLSDTFKPIEFKDFDNFNLADFVSNEDVRCFAKKDENGKITIKISVTHETDNPEIFVKHFKI